MRGLLRCGSFVAMSTDPTPFRTLRARKRADHLVDLRDEIASALTHGLGALQP